MRIVDRKTFLHLPTPVVFAKIDQYGNAGELEIATEMTLHSADEGDFYVLYLDDYAVELDGGDDNRHAAYQRLKAGESLPLHNCVGRDGYFDLDQMFLIYERADLELLGGYIERAIARGEAH